MLRREWTGLCFLLPLPPPEYTGRTTVWARIQRSYARPGATRFVHAAAAAATAAPTHRCLSPPLQALTTTVAVALLWHPELRVWPQEEFTIRTKSDICSWRWAKKNSFFLILFLFFFKLKPLVYCTWLCDTHFLFVALWSAKRTASHAHLDRSVSRKDLNWVKVFKDEAAFEHSGRTFQFPSLNAEQRSPRVPGEYS